MLSTPIVVGGTYISHNVNERDIAALANNIALATTPLDSSPLASPSLPVFVLGDFNARHYAWDPFIADMK